MQKRASLLPAAALALLGAGGTAGAGAMPPAVERLRACLRLDTSNPPGNEIRGALCLKELLEKDGVEAEIFEPEPGRVHLYARLRGTNRERGLLLHHPIDVVPASAAGWERPPFAAALFNDNHRYGRGVLDTKGLGIAQLEAFLADAAWAIDDPRVGVTTLLSAKGESPSPERGLYTVLRRVLTSRFPGAVVAPVLGPGLSENRVFRSRGIPAYGALPFRVNYSDAAGIHGVNERMRADWFAEGVETVTRIVREAATASAATSPPPR